MRIDSYRFGSIVIDGKPYRSDVMIYGDQVKSDWWRKEGHRLHLEDLDWVLSRGPKVLVIGTGANGRMVVPESVKAELESRGIEMIVEPTGEAYKTYNRLRGSNDTNVAAALHLTC
ncbi:MAG: Mth938-like domain-containing protein [Candidatus Bipolaricaulia bacterium]